MEEDPQSFELPEIQNDPIEEQRLRDEFREVDKNGDGRISKVEMNDYLARKGVDEEHRDQIVEELFSKCDIDANGFIDLQEFVQHYVMTKNQLVQREAELKVTILECYKRLSEAQSNLQSATARLGQVVQGPVGILNVNIIRAENLGIGPNEKSAVVLYQGNKTSQTQEQGVGPSPEYGDLIGFEIDDDSQPLIVNCYSLERNVSLLETQVSFENIKEPDFPLNQEFWLNARVNDDHAPRVLLVINYEQNEILKWQGESEAWANEISNEVSILKQVRIFIEQLQAPFGFLLKEVKTIEAGMGQEQEREKQQELQGDHPYHAKEQQFKLRFDKQLSDLASRHNIRYETLPWLEISLGVTLAYLVLTLLSMWQRKDCLNITVCACGIYVLNYPSTIKRSTFRAFVLLILLSWVYDLVYLFVLSSSEAEDEEDGGMEYSVRRFSRMFSYISLVFRVVVLVVFWKDSVDFSKIVREQNPLENQGEELDVERIIALYEQD